MTYAQSGVDIEAGDEVVGLIKHHMRRTYGPRVLGQHGAFAGCFRLDFNEKLFKRNYKDPVLVACTDGVGTKVLLAVQTGILDTIGQDCVAMNVNDMIVQGAEPLFFLDYVAVHEVVPQETADIIKGVADGCSLAGCALLGGETSEMRDVYKKGDFDLAGFAVGVVELKKAIAGPERVEAGDVVLGLASSGVHSNGYSLVRAIIKQNKLKLTKAYPELDPDRTLGEVLLEPTRIYVKPIIEVLHKYKVKKPISAMAHITGGGLPGNLNRSLPSNLDAKLNKKSWDVPAVFGFLQKQGNVSEQEMFKVFNMGIGYTLIVRPHFADAVQRQLAKAGETVYRIGEIVKGSGKSVCSGCDGRAVGPVAGGQHPIGPVGFGLMLFPLIIGLGSSVLPYLARFLIGRRQSLFIFLRFFHGPVVQLHCNAERPCEPCAPFSSVIHRDRPWTKKPSNSSSPTS